MAASMFGKSFYLPGCEPNVVGVETTDRSHEAG
jgi:hypothetical protein